MKLCTHCFEPIKYSTKYDTFYCKECDKWFETTCSDINCEFCAKRPNKPSDEDMI